MLDLYLNSCSICQDLVTEEFPLLMPKVKPDLAETYLCTPIRMDTDLTYSIVGFRPNATKMTAHHMLVYGCEEPGKIGDLDVQWLGYPSHCGAPHLYATLSVRFFGPTKCPSHL